MHFWESYSSAIINEYHQSADEGLDIEEYKDIFFDISKLPQGAIKKKFGDVIFEIITEAKKGKTTNIMNRLLLKKSKH